MLTAKRAVLCGLAAVSLSACGTTAKAPAGSVTPADVTSTNSSLPGFHGKVLDPRRKHFTCIRQHGFAAVETGAQTIQVGQPGVGPLIKFLSTPGAAQYAQMSGQVQSAEVIGAALLYPNQASSHELQIIENCTAKGVDG